MAALVKPQRLATSTLGTLPPGVAVPRYDRARLKRGIVHVGVGGFHRAHQALYLDDLLHLDPAASDFGICGVGLLPGDARMRDVLRAQDHLYTLVLSDAAGDRVRVVGSIVDFLFAPDDPDAVIERMAAPETRIISLTVTESGYCETKATGRLDVAHPHIVHDLANPTRPIGTYGFLAAALRRRRDRGQPAFTVQSCDNLLNNGHVCRRMMLAFLEGLDPSLAEWVAKEVAFPNSMVDRITPATTDAHRAKLREAYGIDDGWPVFAEPFGQWVIEDHFPQGRPAWERIGAQLVGDVEPYERMKIRLLNGSHQVLCYIAMLLGHRHAPEAMRDAQVHELVERFMDREAGPVVPPVPGIDLDGYKRTLRERFANPAINDQLGRIGTDGAARVSEFVLPTVREQLARGGPVDVGAFTVAAWIRFLEGRDDRGVELPFADARGESLRTLAREGGAAAILALRDLFGDLAREPRFVDAVSGSLRDLRESGARVALAACLERSANGRP